MTFRHLWMYYKFIKDHFKKDFLRDQTPKHVGPPKHPMFAGESQVGVLGRPISDPNGLPDGVSVFDGFGGSIPWLGGECLSYDLERK